MILNNRKQVQRHSLCLGCGLCSLSDGVEMIQKDGMYTPSKEIDNDSIEKSCPAKGYNLKQEGFDLFGDVHYRYEIGHYRRLRLGHSSNNKILENASSGGVMTQIAYYLLSTGKVDGVITNRFTYQDDKVRTETYIANTLDELIEGQGSKYCPTSTLSILSRLNTKKRYVLIGIPCQIAGFRKISKINSYLAEQVPYTLANFCGGYRDFKELDFFVSKIAHIKNVTRFRHRGGGQPGSMLIEGSLGEVFKYPYPNYAKISYKVKNERCTLCMDATGELSDFSCGDAWLKSKDHSNPWSIIVARSPKAELILEAMERDNLIIFKDDVTEEELIFSQKSNIASKKYRQYKRLKIRSLLFMYSPFWNDDFPIKSGSLLGELKIMVAKSKTKLINKLFRQI